MATKLFLRTSDGDFLKNSSGQVFYKTLPTIYQEVAYIESTGTQYIELPFGFEATDEVDFKFSIDTSQTTDKYMVSPKTWNNSNNRYAMGVHNSGKYTAGFGASNTSTTVLTPSTTNDGAAHTWHYADKVYTITDLNCKKDCTSITFGSCTTNLKLFYGYNSNTKGKIYYYRHWKNDEPIIYLVPCYRILDGVIGMYDLVNNKFYTNNGSGTFKRGDQVDLPDTYKEVEYISTNTTTGQYIDTNYIPSYSDGFDIRIKFLPVTLSNRYALLANYNQGNGQLSLELKADNHARLWLNNGSLDQPSTNTYGNSSPSNVKFKYQGTTYEIDLNGTVKTGSYTATSVPNYSMWMFLDRMKRTTTFTKQLRIYSCQIRVKNQLVRNFVPCYRKSDTAIGMFDTVNQVFYPNLGTGTFVKGSDIN